MKRITSLLLVLAVLLCGCSTVNEGIVPGNNVAADEQDAFVHDADSEDVPGTKISLESLVTDKEGQETPIVEEALEKKESSTEEEKPIKGNNHIVMQEAMKNYHIKTNGWSDIGQHFTIFPDGKICTGRNINKIPAGIKGANTGAICIECLGNFDKGGDTMSDAQKDAIVGVTKILLDKFGLDARTGVTYHCWWTSGGTSLGTYVKGKSAKTCPGTNFFGGNTREAFEKNLLPLIEKWGKPAKKMLESANDITWELNHTYFPIDDADGFKKVLDEAKENNSPLYWGYYKLVNRIK